MQPTRQMIAALFLVLPALHGCSRPSAADAPAKREAAAAPVRTADAAIAPPEIVQACELVTAREMSAILGAAVRAEPNDHSNGKTECIYTPKDGVSPYVEFSVEWGSGEGAMMGVGMAAQAEPGLASPYEGIGDQAMAVGPMLMIRSGEDLISIVFSGVDDIPAKAKGIFDTARARM